MLTKLALFFRDITGEFGSEYGDTEDFYEIESRISLIIY